MMNWLRKQGFFLVLLLNLPPLSENKRKKLLEIVDAVYTPDECSSSLTKKVKNVVHRVFFPPREPVTETGKVRAYLGRPYLIQAADVLAKRYRPQAVIAEYVFATPCLRELPADIFKLVDTHDLLSHRDPGESIYCSPEEERAFLLNADAVIAIQEAEAEMFRALVPERKVVTAGIDYEVVSDAIPDEELRDTVLVVGSNYPANIAGIRSFCEHAWPLVCRENPRAELLVAGKIGDALTNDVPQAKKMGWVDDLAALYRKSSIVINPTMSGTGLKIKTVEALCHGKPLVATPNAVEGLPFQGEAPWVLGEKWPEFAEAVVSLLEDDERRASLRKSAIRYAGDQFSEGRVYAQLGEILRGRVRQPAYGPAAG